MHILHIPIFYRSLGSITCPGSSGMISAHSRLLFSLRLLKNKINPNSTCITQKSTPLRFLRKSTMFYRFIVLLIDLKTMSDVF